MHNLANYPLTNRQQIALSLGLEYIPVPTIYKHQSPEQDIVSAFHNFSRRIRNDYYFLSNPMDRLSSYDPLFHVSSSWQAPSTNQQVEHYLDHVEQQLLTRARTVSTKTISHRFNPPWLIPTLRELRNNADIIVTAADKNMGTAVVTTTDYINEALRQLSDVNTYQQIDNYNDNDVWNKLDNILAQHNYLFRQQDGSFIVNPTHKQYVNYLRQLKGSPSHRPMAHFYMLMKVHKAIPQGRSISPGRPIVSSINSTTYYASKYVDRQLQQLYRRQNTFLSSSQHLLYLLTHRNPFPNDCIILCADIESLYPNIPTNAGLTFFKASLMHNNLFCYPGEVKLTDSEIALLVDLTRFVLTNNVFSFGDATFLQLNGTAMGTPLAVVYACLVVNQIERLTLSRLPDGHGPLFIRRYIDDFFIVMKSIDDAQLFMNKFNSVIPTIRCTDPLISDTQGVMLDMVIFKDATFHTTGKFATKLYQKTQNKYLYLPPSSFHSHHMFPAVVRSEIRRYRLLCSRDCDFAETITLFRTRLIARGYQPRQLNKWFAAALRDDRTSLLNELTLRFRRRGSQLCQKKPPLHLKVTSTPETRTMNTTACLSPPQEFSIPGNPVFELFRATGPPITCYQNAPAISTILNKARTSLHDVSIVAKLNDPSVL